MLAIGRGAMTRNTWPDILKSAFQLLHIPESLVDVALTTYGNSTEEALSKNAIESANNITTSIPLEFRALSKADREATEELTRELLQGALDDYEVLHVALGDPRALPDLLLSRVPVGRVDNPDANAYLRILLEIACRAIIEQLDSDNLRNKVMVAGLSQILRALTDLQQSERSKGSNGILATSHINSPVELTRQSLRAATAVAPNVIPEVDRMHLFQNSGINSYPLVLLGEGGSGKSVLASQFFERLAGDHNELTLFLACSRVPSTANLNTHDQVDRALANALGQEGFGIKELVKMAHIGSLVIDTIDLLLSEDSSPAILEVLTDLANETRLVVTCRKREWKDHLEQLPNSGFTPFHVPLLDKEQVLKWTKLYTDHHLAEVKEPEVFVSSLAKSLSSPHSLDLFGSPLRLTMTCETYGPAGELPENLTVTKLYNDYWNSRIETDRFRQRGNRAAKSIKAAKKLARKLWGSSHQRFTEYCYMDKTSTGIKALASEGIIHFLNDKAAFFHQSFAEYAIARHLAAKGEEADWSRLETGLAAGIASDWGIVSHLVNLKLDPLTFNDVLACLPDNVPESIRLVWRGLVQQGDLDALKNRVQVEVDRNPEQVLDSLDSIIRGGDEVCTAVLPFVLPLASQKLGRSHFFNSFAKLLLSSSSPRKTAWLVEAVTLAIINNDSKLSGDLVTLFNNTVAQMPSHFDPKDMLEIYPSLPSGAKATIAGAVVAISDEADCFDVNYDDEVLSFLKVALSYRAAVKSEDQWIPFRDVTVRAMGIPSVQHALGWGSWRKFLDIEYPDGWRRVQTECIAALDYVDEKELLAALCETDLVRRKEYNDAARARARLQPLAMAHSLSNLTGTWSRAATSSLAQVGLELARYRVETRALWTAFHRWFFIKPLEVGQVLAALSIHDEELLQRTLNELRNLAEQDQTSENARIIRRIWLELFNGLSLDLLEKHSEEMLSTFHHRGAKEKVLEARMLAQLSPRSDAAREWVTSLWLSRGNTSLANETAKILAGYKDQFQSNQDISWLVGLLGTNYGNPAKIASQLLSAENIVPHIDQKQVSTIVNRTHDAVRSNEDIQVLSELLMLLTSLARCEKPVLRPDEAHRIYMELWNALIKQQDMDYQRTIKTDGLYQSLNTALTGICMPLISEEEMMTYVVRLLTEIDTGRIGHKPRRKLASTLISVTNRYPIQWHRIHQCWAEVSLHNKQAMAEWITGGKVPGKEIIIQELARRDDCPEEISHDLLRYLGI